MNQPSGEEQIQILQQNIKISEHLTQRLSGAEIFPTSSDYTIQVVYTHGSAWAQMYLKSLELNQ